MKTEPKEIADTPVSKKIIRAGRMVAALPVLFLLFDSVTNLVNLAPGLESFIQLGYLESLARGVWVLELVSHISRRRYTGLLSSHRGRPPHTHRCLMPEVQ